VIETLRIRDWVIVAEAELEFGPGLNVLTGETGTGKSIVLGALSLLAGGRGSADAVRTGSERAFVEAVFRTEATPDFELELARRDLYPEVDGEGVAHELVVSRTISASGRSRARVAGELVPASVLAELLSGRIEISSQHSSQSLLRPDVQGRLLDEAGGLLPVRTRVSELVAELRASDAERVKLQALAEERARQQDFLAFQVSDIDAVGLASGELDELAAEHRRLAHADRLLVEGWSACASLLGQADAGSDGEVVGARDLVTTARRALEGVSDLDSRLGDFAERLRGCETELEDVASDLERYVSSVEADPQRLAEVEERLAIIESLRRKYGQSEREIAEFRERAVNELAAIEGAEARIDELATRRAELAESLATAARELTQGRVDSARELGAEVAASLADLGMPGARFEVGLESLEPPESLACGANGSERAEFLFAGNPGDALRPLQRVVSGGELSRVFLAVRNALRRKSRAGMVLVFDEVDAGIGGQAAERVGRALAELARHHQVLCITHLPQIAAFGDVHFRVQKREKRGRAVAEIARVEGDLRIDEIARMAGGRSVTAATRKHAAELLGSKGPSKTI
jgi:DNA repair protein RecN (Recombination protein N)